MIEDYIDERAGIPCKGQADCFLPDRKVSGQEYPLLGKFGMMRRTYLGASND